MEMDNWMHRRSEFSGRDDVLREGEELRRSFLFPAAVLLWLFWLNANGRSELFPKLQTFFGGGDGDRGFGDGVGPAGTSFVHPVDNNGEIGIAHERDLSTPGVVFDTAEVAKIDERLLVTFPSGADLLPSDGFCGKEFAKRVR